MKIYNLTVEQLRSVLFQLTKKGHNIERFHLPVIFKSHWS